MQGGVENYLAQTDSNNEYKLMFQDTLPYQKWNDISRNMLKDDIQTNDHTQN